MMFPHQTHKDSVNAMCLGGIVVILYLLMNDVPLWD